MKQYVIIHFSSHLQYTSVQLSRLWSFTVSKANFFLCNTNHFHLKFFPQGHRNISVLFTIRRPYDCCEIRQPYSPVHLCLSSLQVPPKHLLILSNISPHKWLILPIKLTYIAWNVTHQFNKVIEHRFQNSWLPVTTLVVKNSQQNISGAQCSCKPITHTYLVSFILCFASVLWSARFSLSNWGRKKSTLIKISLLKI